MFRAPILLRSSALDVAEHELHLSPERIFDDSQIGHVFDQPIALGVGADQMRSGAGIKHLAGAVEDQLTDVKAILEDAVLALAITVDRGGSPKPRIAGSATRCFDLVLVEPFCDRARGLTRCKLLANAGSVGARQPAITRRLPARETSSASRQANDRSFGHNKVGNTRSSFRRRERAVIGRRRTKAPQILPTAIPWQSRTPCRWPKSTRTAALVMWHALRGTHH